MRDKKEKEKAQAENQKLKDEYYGLLAIYYHDLNFWKERYRLQVDQNLEQLGVFNAKVYGATDIIYYTLVCI